MRSKFRLARSRTAMPARWQSSQRPLFVRTVWVNGLRHAILSADDPLLQCRSPAVSNAGGVRPGSCSSVGTFTSSSSGSNHHCEDTTSCDLEHCLIKLQLVLTSSKSASKSPNTRTSSSHNSATSSSHQNMEPCCDSGNDLLQDMEENNSVTQASMVGHYRRPYLPYVFPSSSEEDQEEVEDDRWMFSDVGTLLPDIQLNPLSERVLQWLDLARKSAGVAEIERSIPMTCCEKRISKERPVTRYVSPSVHSRSPEVTNQRRYSSKRTLPKQKSADLGKISTVVLETASNNSTAPEECLHVSARGMKTMKKKRQTLENMRAVIDETVRCECPVREKICDVPKTFEESLPISSVTPPPAPSPPLFPPMKPGINRPQLHIFMPTLQRDRPILQHQDAADTISECDSYWSEA